MNATTVANIAERLELYLQHVASRRYAERPDGIPYRTSLKPVSWSSWKRIVWPLCTTGAGALTFASDLANQLEEESN